MAIYTLTTNLIENLKSTDHYIIASLLNPLVDPHSNHRIAIDKNKRLYKLYADEVRNVNTELKESYLGWLSLLSYQLATICDFIDVDVSTHDRNRAFLEVASHINGCKDIIVYSRNSGCPYPCDGNNNTSHNGETIKVLDKNEAIDSIKNNSTQVINYNTQVNVTNMSTGNNSPIINGNGNNIEQK